MNTKALLALLVIIIIPSLTFLPRHYPPEVRAQIPGAARLEVWSDVYRSNITDLALTSGQFSVEVNVTGAGPINGFDVTLNYYNLTISPVVFNAVVLNATGTSFLGSIFSSAPCSSSTLKNEVDIPPGTIRVAAILLGCSVDGSGTLFTLTFDIVGIGAAAIDIIPTDGGGKPQTYVASSGRDVLYEPFDAYFRNKPGIPPVAEITYDPPEPFNNATITFDGTSSFDPNDSAGSDKGIRRFLWKFGDSTPGAAGNFLDASKVDHRYISPPVTPLSGNFTVRLIVYDYADGLASRKTLVIFVKPGTIHNIAVSVSGNRNQLTQGEILQVTVTVSNNGNRDEKANLTVTYDYQTTTTIGEELAVSLILSSRKQTFQYNLDTRGIPARTYTVEAVGAMYNETIHQEISDDRPADNTSTVTFNLLSSSGTSSLPLPIVGAAAVVAVVAVLLVLRLARRRRVED